MDDQALRAQLHRAGYIADDGLALALARAQGRKFVRLQCHEGLDLAQAAYELNYGRQLLAIQLDNTRLHETQGDAMRDVDLFARDCLLERPLLQAISSPEPCVLLIDEIDRADEAFEAFLLEVLADYQITVPERGTLKAVHAPQVLLTSNGTRELSDALRRRCLHRWLDCPTLAREIAAVRATLPQAEAALVDQAVAFVQRLRRDDPGKTPGVAETLDGVRALHRLNFKTLPDEPARLEHTLACLLKTCEDRLQFGPDNLRQVLEGRSHAGVAIKNATAGVA